MEVTDKLENLMNTMEILKQIEQDLRSNLPKAFTKQDMDLFIAILDLIAGCDVPDVRFITSNNTLIGEA